MPASIIQAVFADDKLVTGTTVTATLTNVQAGSTILAFTTNDDGTALVSVSDPTNGTYTLIQSIDDVSDTQSCASSYKPNVAHTAGNLVITATWNPADGAKGLIAIEIGDVNTTSPLDGHAAVIDVSPGAGANAITLGPPSPNNADAPALAVAFCFDVHQLETTSASAGTGWAQFGTGWDFGLGVNYATLASQRVTAASPKVTFTAGSGGGTSTFILMEAIFDEIGASKIQSGNAIFYGSE